MSEGKRTMPEEKGGGQQEGLAVPHEKQAAPPEKQAAPPEKSGGPQERGSGPQEEGSGPQERSSGPQEEGAVAENQLQRSPGAGSDADRSGAAADRREAGAGRSGSISGRAAGLPARVAVALLSVTVLLATGVSWATLGSLERGLNTTDALSAAPVSGGHGASAGSDGAMDILLVGSDSRTDAQGDPLPPEVLRALRTEESVGTNTDTIILVRVPDDGTAAHAVSIPRDTYVAIPGRQPDKINSAYGLQQASAAKQLREQGVTDEVQISRNSAHAGRLALVKTVQQLTGVDIDHYAEVNLYGFFLLTNAIGGVEVCLNEATTDPGSGANFPAGRQTLAGGDALSFVRQRNGLPRGDLDRIVRQQVFMAGAVRQLLSAGTLANPSRLSELASAARRAVVLDRGWDLLGFAQQMQGIAAGSVNFVTIPVVNTDARDPRGYSIVTVDQTQVRAFVANLVGAPAPTPSGGPTILPASPSTAATPEASQQPTVDVLNGTDVTGLASEVSQRLVEAGFVAGDTDNTARRRTTIIKVAPGKGPMGERVSAELGGDIPVQADPELADDQIVVLIGSDYTALSGSRWTGPALLRLDGTAPPAVSRATPPPPPINAEGVPCIN